MILLILLTVATLYYISLTRVDKRQPPYMGWLRLVGSIKLQVSCAKETYKRDNILQTRAMI